MSDRDPALTHYRLRPYRDGDFAAVEGLWERCGLHVWYNDPKVDIPLWLDTEHAEILLAERDDRLAGTICVGHDGHRGWLYKLAVDPELRRCGLGRRLVAAAEEWLGARRVRKVELMIRPSNAAVQRFYEAIGYEVTPRLVMQRWLVDLQAEAAAVGRMVELPSAGGAELKVTITYLEITERPALQQPHPPATQKIALMRAEHPTVGFYRYLYDTIGEEWLWWARRAMKDAELEAIISDERVEVYVLYVDGMPAGYFELDRRQADEIELAYFGLMPQFVGRQLGPYLLYAAIEIAWDHEPRRLWVNTCTLDHPKALPLYQRMGFRPYKQRVETITDPRSTGLIRPDVTGI